MWYLVWWCRCALVPHHKKVPHYCKLSEDASLPRITLKTSCGIFCGTLNMTFAARQTHFFFSLSFFAVEWTQLVHRYQSSEILV